MKDRERREAETSELLIEPRTRTGKSIVIDGSQVENNGTYIRIKESELIY